MSLRTKAVLTAISRKPRTIQRPVDGSGQPLAVSEFFGSQTFGLDQIKEKLAKESSEALLGMVSNGTTLSKAVADEVSNVIKDWAMRQGVTHFCHWFQPMTGLTAEKHDAFIQTKTSESGQTTVIEKFSGSALIQSEPDASSFPSGGMRTTFEARGYTAWDPSSPLFIIEGVNGKTLCIPSAFLSYHGQALDLKTPLLRSNDALQKQGTRFLKLLGDLDILSIKSTLGVEQEYFLVDKALFAARPDLVMTGRTLLGRASTRGQQFEDHYFGSIPARVLAFMNELETEVYKLGIPLKTRHNEVAPGQFEIAPIFENADLASDHNALLMDILIRIAIRHDFVCLLHEKPFAGINGSGKHCNWSISTDKGTNLLDPGRTPHQNLRFLAVLTATIKAVHDHSAMLRVGIASANNDHRLGANEAPPAIISVFLGQNLESIVSSVEKGVKNFEQTSDVMIHLGVAKLPVVAKDNTDRNRTSPFAFTGNKFEFRAVGSSASVAFPVSILNAAVAQSLDELSTRLEEKLGKGTPRDEAVLSLLQEVLKETRSVRFEGNNYSDDWKTEAQKRGLPNLADTPSCLNLLADSKYNSFLVKQKVLSEDEVMSRYHVLVERYNKQIEMEASTLLEIADTHVIPALEDEILRADKVATITASKGKEYTMRLDKLTDAYGQIFTQKSALEAALDLTAGIHDESKKAEALRAHVFSAMEKLRTACDSVEGLVADENWTLPKYRELLFVR